MSPGGPAPLPRIEGGSVTNPIAVLAGLARELQAGMSLEPMLQAIVDRAALLLGTARVSLRLLDPGNARLVATCRAGGALHRNATSEYRLGEGLIGWIALHGQSLRLDHPERDARYVPRPDQVEPMGSFLGVPLRTGRQTTGVLSSVSPNPSHFDESHQQVLELLSGLCAPYLEVARLSRLAQLDALTGAFNRRGLDVTLPAGVRSDRRVCVAMADLDHFKVINDQFGHAVGDEVLRRVTRVLAETLRAEDSVVRYGGEEFLLVLPGVELSAAAAAAERVRAAVERTAISTGAGDHRVTISIGCAEQSPGETREDAISRADAALYRAKRAGRNRVEHA